MPYSFYSQATEPPTHPKQPIALRKSCLYQQLPPSHTGTGLEFASVFFVGSACSAANFEKKFQPS
jgi:hypothetical protein